MFICQDIKGGIYDFTIIILFPYQMFHLVISNLTNGAYSYMCICVYGTSIVCHCG